jgi:hypothetical protein
MSADGQEERAMESAEQYERDIDDADVAEMLADEDITLVTQVPVRCVVYSHDWHPKTHYCRRCGQDRNDEVGQTRAWL